MKLNWLVGMLVSVAVAGPAVGQQTPQGQVPSGETMLGPVSLPRSVMADGKPLKAGSYQLRLTAQTASPSVAGQQMERWVEFLQGGKVVGREVASIIPADEVKDLNSQAKGPKPGAGGTRVEMLKGDEYLRIWVNRRGVNYLIHLPPARG
jgi:hypothetical protein